MLAAARSDRRFLPIFTDSVVRDCSLFIGSTGPVFRGTGQGLFLMLPSTGHKDFFCFYGTGHELFLEKIKLYLYNISGW